jgi:hypothetical protein
MNDPIEPGCLATLEGGDPRILWRVVGVGPDQFDRLWVSAVMAKDPKPCQFTTAPHCKFKRVDHESGRNAG